MVDKAPQPVPEDAPAHVAFERIVCGIDGSPEADEAARQATLLAPAGGHVLLVEAAAGEAGRILAEADLAAARSAGADGVAIVVAVRVGPAAEMLEHEALHLHADAI